VGGSWAADKTELIFVANLLDRQSTRERTVIASRASRLERARRHAEMATDQVGQQPLLARV
jgi:hypothetical protein